MTYLEQIRKMVLDGVPKKTLLETLEVFIQNEKVLEVARIKHQEELELQKKQFLARIRGDNEV
jgi:hypothetical protein